MVGLNILQTTWCPLPVVLRKEYCGVITAIAREIELHKQYLLDM